MNLLKNFLKLPFFLLMAIVAFGYVSANAKLPNKLTIKVENGSGSGTVFGAYVFDRQTKQRLYKNRLVIGDSKTYNLKPLHDYEVAIGVAYDGIITYGVNCYYYMTANPLISSGTIKVKSGGEFSPHITHGNSMVYEGFVEHHYHITCPFKDFS